MALTHRQRERAVEMFEEGKLTTAQIAKRIRAEAPSIAALRANWTRGNNVLGSAISKVKSTTSASSSTKSSSSSSEPMVVRIQSRKLTNAVRSGRPVELVFNL